MKKAPIIKIGVDFDGVVAYNPLRIFRAPVTGFKRKILKKKSIEFFIPKTRLEKTFFQFAHDLSLFPGNGIKFLSNLKKNKTIEAHLISGRYNYLNPSMQTWLKRYKLEGIFSSINVNEKNEQPHIFKNRVLDQLKLDYFIEDNLDIVLYLSTNTQTKIIWIYNIIDRFYPYRDKFPNLRRALENIIQYKPIS